MISGYKIINQNNDEDVLFLYLDFSFEFGGKKQSNEFNDNHRKRGCCVETFH